MKVGELYNYFLIIAFLLLILIYILTFYYEYYKVKREMR